MQAKDNYEKMQQMIAAGTRFNFHDDQSPRILPKEVQPVVDKRVVEIPIENTQAVLPEPKRGRGKVPKRPPKKFHMPDGVRTGFTKASRLGGEDEDDDEEQRLPARSKQTKLKVPEVAPIPMLEEVLLSQAEEQELSRKYRDKVADEYNDAPVTVPALDLHPAYQRKATATAAVKHGSSTRSLVSLLNRMHNTTSSRVDELGDTANMQDLDKLCGEHDRVVDNSDMQSSKPQPAAKKPRAKLKKAPAPAINLDSDAELPDIIPQTAKKPRGRPKKAAAITTSTNVPYGTNPDTPAPVKKPRGRPKKTTATTTTSFTNMDAIDAMEGVSSSPPRTDPRYAIASQGITLGTQDTEGEEEDDVLDSDLRDFVVEGDEEDVFDAAPLLTSSIEAPKGRDARVKAGRRKLVGGGRAKELDEDESDRAGNSNDHDVQVLDKDDRGLFRFEDGDSDELPELSTLVARKGAKEKPQHNKRRRMVVDDDDSE